MSSKVRNKRRLAPVFARARRRLANVNRAQAGLAFVAGFGLASATAPSAHSLPEPRAPLAGMSQIVDLAVVVARNVAMPGTAGLHVFEAGKLVSQDVSAFDLAKLDVSAFGDHDDTH